LKLYFEDLGGDGAPLLMVAGMATDAVSWVFQTPALSPHFRLILCDNRGVGRSPKPAGPYCIEDMASDLVELLDELKLDRVHVCGHSMGGAIAQQLALQFPQRVDRLVLACSSACFNPRSLAVVESWSGCVRAGASPELLGRVLFPWLYTADFFEQSGQLEAAISALAAHPYALDAVGLEGQVEALRAHDLRGQLGELRAPTLVLGAEHDLLVTASECQELAAGVPAARLEWLTGTGHSCMLQTPDAFNQALVRFFCS
jgi:3-oxoadipate enol-lactonase